VRTVCQTKAEDRSPVSRAPFHKLRRRRPCVCNCSVAPCHHFKASSDAMGVERRACGTEWAGRRLFRPSRYSPAWGLRPGRRATFQNRQMRIKVAAYATSRWFMTRHVSCSEDYQSNTCKLTNVSWTEKRNC
jgi:hypothetical protein